MGELKEKIKAFLLKYGIAFGIGCIFTASLAYFIFILPLANVHARDVKRNAELQSDTDRYRERASELTRLLEDARTAAGNATEGIDSAIGSIGDGQRGVEESQKRVRGLQDGSAGDLRLAQEIARQTEDALRGIRDIQKRLAEGDR